MVKVSIVVPVYKAEKCIGKCIQSLINQTVKDIEIILVDDGSPDNSGAICDEFSLSDERIRVIHKENGGVSSARNRGIEEAVGEYIVFVDSDDWVEENYVKRLLEAKNKCENSEVLCGYKTINTTVGGTGSNTVFSSLESDSVVPLDKYMELVNRILVQSPWNKLFKSSIIKDNSIKFDEKISLGEDLIFCLEYYDLCGSENIVCINEPLYNYIVTGNESLNTKYYPNLIELDRYLYKRLEDFILSHGADERQIEIFNNGRFFRFVSALENTYRKGNKASAKEKRKTNSEILRSDEFKKSLGLLKAYIHPIHKIAYKSGSWTLVQIAYKITSLKGILKRLTNGKKS